VLPGVRGDHNQLMQVFFNIVNNGLDAMGDNSGGVMTIKTLRDRGSVVILFSDTGPGIKEPHRVFDPFYTTKPVGKGTGLGLSICYGIVQEHSGKILAITAKRAARCFAWSSPQCSQFCPAKAQCHPARLRYPVNNLKCEKNGIAAGQLKFAAAECTEAHGRVCR